MQIIFMDDKKKKARIELLIETVIVTVILIIIAIGMTYKLHTPEGVPFSFSVLDKEMLVAYIWVALIIAFALFTYLYKRYVISLNSRKDEEYGSSKFMTERDMPIFRKNFFFNPETVKQCTDYTALAKKTVFNKEQLKKTLKNTRPLEKCIKTTPLKPFESDKDRLKYENNPYYQCFFDSQILAQDIYLSMNCKFLNRNLNTLTIGGSGQGKSYSELIPNALNANANYVFCDPSGEILQKTGKFLESQGYEIRVFNVKNFRYSMRYNPFVYLETEADYNILVDAINRNIKGDKPKGNSSNEFFEDAKDSLMVALIALMKEIYPNNPERWTFANVMELLRMSEQKVSEDGQTTTSDLDELFKKLGAANRRSYAVKMWNNFRVAGPKVCNEVLVSASAVYGKYFDTDEMANLTMCDELDLWDLASDKKYALYIAIPQNTGTYNFMAAMVYSQIFQIVDKAGEENRKRNNLSDPKLPRHVSLWLDEFANSGRIPDFLLMLAVVRKYGISINIIIQTLNQLKSMYKDSWETIIGNCDSMVYLGGQAPGDIKLIMEKLGKETIKSHNYNEGKNSSEGYQNMGRELLTNSEIEQMSRSNELVFITGNKPFMAKKYDLKKHPNYKFSGEYSPENNMDVERFYNDLDIDLLEDNTIRPEDLLDMEFEKKTYGHKRKSTASDPEKPALSTVHDKEKDKNPVGSSDVLSEEEKQRRSDYINSHSDSLNLPIEQAATIILRGKNAEVFAGFEPDYEFSNKDFSIADFELEVDEAPPEIHDTNNAENFMEVKDDSVKTTDNENGNSDAFFDSDECQSWFQEFF